ncbi:gene transfer agent family protein [Sinorhizobium sp. BG8]|uniref:gene transfer agent family protein n=1 Tax=Sinorhizobium sp. BG8 TaxID=2613773 RepID=UPI00193CE939|nr:gene transfer agent family protein [Sinorhizobium sp. BG8]QRM54756.1 gene transfer agent family protein [Sinorhizobium sp. BG8]
MGARANRHRGEIEAILDGERRILCLTLGALAELETAFAADNLAALAGRFASGQLRALDIIHIIGAGLRGGGNIITDDEVAGMVAEGGLSGFAWTVSALLTATFGEATDGGGENPPEPQPGA